MKKIKKSTGLTLALLIYVSATAAYFLPRNTEISDTEKYVTVAASYLIVFVLWLVLRMKELAGKWQHIYICFDGRMEQVYVNGKLVSEKDIQLLVKPSQFITLGRNAEGNWPFTGYLHSLKLWDEYLPLKE